MKIGIDVDLTLCGPPPIEGDYWNCKPLPGAKEALIKLKKLGHEIIIYTARGQKTSGGNPGKVFVNRFPELVRWLDLHEMPYDEIWQKPHCQVFIDDKGYKFTGDWEQTLKDIL